MVVEGGGKRLAVECDGDRYHPIEKLAEDVERQAILERLGWKFIRIRGSVFYRNSELAMQTIFSKLEELEIPPEGNSTEAPLNDMTLVHELVELMNRDTESAESVVDHADLDGDAIQVLEDGDFGLEVDGSLDLGSFSGIPVDRQRGQVEMLLESLGGAASIEDFLRHFAKAKGYQRLGKIVRKSLKSELSSLKRKGKISIENGAIRLS